MANRAHQPRVHPLSAVIAGVDIFARRMNAIIALIGGALLIVAAWLLLAATLAGVGLLFHRPWRRSEPLDPDDGFTLIWIGYAVTLLVLQSLHFFRPIDSWSLVVIGTAGVIGVAMNVQNARSVLATLFRVENR